MRRAPAVPRFVALAALLAAAALPPLGAQTWLLKGPEGVKETMT